ncbi:hypothetical protein ABE488_12370 [Luteimonas sp. TWI662]|uniref:hypothetical protein n=1 Tax=Luteimonas sp. TWI662 TaxID=3136789 RepID=UPI003209BF93
MGERSDMFLDPLTLVFFITCVVSFLLGSISLSPRRQIVRSSPHPALSRTKIAAPLILAVGLNLLSITIFLKSNPSFLTGWLEDAYTAKKELDVAGGLTEALPLLYAICCWALWRLLEREDFNGRPDYVLRALIGIGMLVATFTAVAKVARYDLMPGISGFFITYFIFKTNNGSKPFLSYLLSLGRFAVVIVSAFLLFSWLRGGDERSALFQDLMGYTGASYNRLAALLNGDITFPHAGSGTYAFRFLSHIPFIHRWIDLGDIFGIPQSSDVWASEFGAVHQAGLDGRYIWVSAFGYVFSDLGFLVFPYFFAIGVIAKFSWRSIRSGNTFGLFLYPWMAFSVLFWFGSHYFVYSRVLTLLGGAIVIFLYEAVVRGRLRLR